MAELTLPFSKIRSADLPDVGGKGANLGEMTHAGVPVPPGFCITTTAFDAFLRGVEGLEALLVEVDALDPEDVAGVRRVAGQIREGCVAAALPEEVKEAALAGWRALGDERFYAVRSSATLEDLPDASFAGQQDTYLNVLGEAELLKSIQACWASLFTDRAVLYRRQHGYQSTGAKLSVVVQQMAEPEVSGILFTADPITGHRGVCSIDASWGLGEALVSGLVNADLYRVDKKTGKALSVRVGNKQLGIFSLPGGGTEKRDLDKKRANARVLGDDALAKLAALARTVEAHYGTPQDIEWCLEEDGTLRLVQTRPVTSLFGTVDRPDDGLRVFASFNHVQVMTDPIRPFGTSLLSHVIPLGKDTFAGPSDLLYDVDHRIYADLTPALHTFPFSRIIPTAMQLVDPVMASILETVIKRPDFKKRRPPVFVRRGRLMRQVLGPVLVRTLTNFFIGNPAAAAGAFTSKMESAVAGWRRKIGKTKKIKGRVRLLPALLGDVFGTLIPLFPPSLIAGGLSWRLLRKLTAGRLSSDRVDQLTRGLEGNVTTQMDLELGDLADELRKHEVLAEIVSAGEPSTVLERLRAHDDAGPFFDGWATFLDRYGHRCPGEIDATNPRWRERPLSLINSLRGMLAEPEPGLHRKQEQRMQEDAAKAGEEILAAVNHGLFSGLRRRIAARLIRNVRHYMALREHGKYFALMYFALAREIALEVGDVLVERGLLTDREDAFYFRFEELEPLLGAKEGDDDPSARVDERKRSVERARKLAPPRILTSEGEAPPRPPPKNLPPGALGGVPASNGTVEGIARVVMDPSETVLEHGEILIAPFTDPGWTPLFVHASGLVMEVGGLMTHGSVVAREYGIPAVVGVDRATTLIKTGDRIRVDGGTGIVEFLEDPAEEVPTSDAAPGSTEHAKEQTPTA